MLRPSLGGEAPAGPSLGAGCVGAHLYRKEADASHGLTVNFLGRPLGLFQAVANSVGK